MDANDLKKKRNVLTKVTRSERNMSIGVFHNVCALHPLLLWVAFFSGLTTKKLPLNRSSRKMSLNILLKYF